MKSSLTAAAFVTLSLSTPLVSAQDRAPPDTDKQLSQMQKDMNAMLVQIAKLRQQSQLRKNVNAMQRQLEDLESTTDPKERQALLRAHMRTLEEQMQMVRSMTESEGGSPAKQEPAQAAPASPGRMIYGPGPMGFPGSIMHGPGKTGGPPGYPGWTVKPRYR
jgi:TolA-binding protein